MSAILEFVPDDNRSAPALATIVRALQAGIGETCGDGSSFEERERAALSLANDAIREVLEVDLQKEADALPKQVLVNDALYRRHQPGSVQYHSLVGPLQVWRWTYRHTGIRNGPTVVPLELEAGLVERATPALGYRMALGQAKGPLRSCHEDMLADYRRPPSRTTMERMAKRIADQAKDTVLRIEDHLRETELLPKGTVAVTMGLDRTTIPMEEDRDPNEPPRTRRKKRSKPYVRSPRPPVDVHYRMGYVGTVAFVDQDGETLASRKYAVPAEDGPTTVVHRVMADVRQALRQDPTIQLGLIQDGAAELWGLMWDALDRDGLRDRCYQLIDRYHVSERLGAVAALIESDKTKRKELLTKWECELDRYTNAIDRIYETAEKAWWGMKRGTRKWNELSGHLTYLFPMARLRYAPYVKKNLPIGSGVTEGACKSVIEARTKRSGQRWRTEGVRGVLTLRSIQESGRLPEFWEHFRKLYGEPVQLAA